MTRLASAASAACALLLAGGCALQDAPLGLADAGPGGDAASDAFVPGRDGGPDAWVPPSGDAGPDAFVPPVDSGGVDAGPVDAGCTAAADRCIAGTVTRCDGATGALVTEPCPLGCAATEPRCARLVPSNVSASLIDRAAADRSVSSDVTWDSDGCSGAGLTLATQGDGSQVCLLRVGALAVAAGATVRVTGPRPLIVLAAGPVTVAGDVDLSARGVQAGPGGFSGGNRSHRAGYGPHAGGGGQHAPSYDDGGGGGGALCGSGGFGGTGDDAPGGPGGSAAAATWELEPLYGGSGGGLGQGAAGSGYDNNGYGGAGGGALQISSLVSISVSGRILAGGGGGDEGNRTSSDSINWGAGGGGGAGGAVLLEAPEVTFPGSGIVIVTGGGGGGGAGWSGAGTDGQDGALSTDRAAGGVGGSDIGAAGGESGGGTVLAGASGVSNPSNYSNGGGGGGGAGCVLLRDASGALPPGAERSSPRIAPGLRALPARRE